MELDMIETPNMKMAGVHVDNDVVFGLSLNDGYKIDSIMEAGEYEVMPCAILPLLNARRDEGVQCECCGRKANMWVAKTFFSRHTQRMALSMTIACVEGNLAYQMTCDHIIPFSIGGTDDLDNQRLLCSECNVERASDLDDATLEFIAANADMIDQDRYEDGIDRLHNRLLGNNFDVKGVDRQITMYNKLKNFVMGLGIPQYKTLPTKLRTIEQQYVRAKEKRKLAKTIKGYWKNA